MECSNGGNYERAAHLILVGKSAGHKTCQRFSHNAFSFSLTLALSADCYTGSEDRTYLQQKMPRAAISLSVSSSNTIHGPMGTFVPRVGHTLKVGPIFTPPLLALAVPTLHL
jgi:hypothetical protein